MSSTRIWLTCGAATAVAVACVLLFTNRPAAEANGAKGPPAPPPLTEQEVRAYLLLKPGVDRILKDIAGEFQATRRPGQADDEALGEKARARVDALLQKEHLTREEWLLISERVERVVHLVRGEAEFPEARPGIVQRLEMKKNLLKTLGQADPRRPAIEKEIRETETLLANGPPAVGEKDRELVMRYWASLSEIATTVGPAPRPESPEALPER